MEQKEIDEIKSDILLKMREKDEAVKGIQYIEELQLLESKNEYYGLNENDIFLAKKEQEKDNKKVIVYDIYSKDGALIGTADEKGNVELTDEYKKALEEKYKSLYKKFGIGKRQIQIANIEKYINENEIEEETQERKTEDKLDEKEAEDKEEEEIENSEQMAENEQVEKMEESLGLEPKDIKSSSEITDQQFYEIVPEAKEYNGKVSIVYVGSTNEFMIVGIDKKTGQYKPLDTVEASKAVQMGEANEMIDLGRDGSEVKTESLNAIIKLKNTNDYSFSAKLEGINPIKFQGLRQDRNLGEDNNKYIAWDIDTSHQYPATQKVADMVDTDKNKDITEEIKKYNDEMAKGNEVTTIEKIEDDKLKTNYGDKKEEKEKEQENEDREKTPWDHLKKYGY